MPITISCYVLHPLAARFVSLWRYAQVASDVVVFFLSFLCCQCADVPGRPLDGSEVDSTASSYGFQIKPMDHQKSRHDNACSQGRPPCVHDKPGPESGDYRPDGELWEIIDVYGNVPLDPPEVSSSSRARKMTASPEDNFPCVHKN